METPSGTPGMTLLELTKQQFPGNTIRHRDTGDYLHELVSEGIYRLERGYGDQFGDNQPDSVWADTLADVRMLMEEVDGDKKLTNWMPHDPGWKEVVARLNEGRSTTLNQGAVWWLHMLGTYMDNLVKMCSSSPEIAINTLRLYGGTEKAVAIIQRNYPTESPGTEPSA